MSAFAETPFAWEPFTPRGVAAFARARLGRLFLVQLVVAMLAAASVIWFLDTGCFPTIGAAIRQLPETGEIRNGRLTWSGPSPQELAEGKFLAFDVDPEHSGRIRSPRDVQIEFGAESVRVFSLLGYADLGYPPAWEVPFNRLDLEPLWGAWAAEILFLVFVATVLMLLVSWWLLATIYFLPAWLIGFYGNRDLDWCASWKLSAAALLPGALWMTAGVWLYGSGLLNLVAFAFVFAAHFVVAWIYLFLSQPFLPRTEAAPVKGNPFRPQPPA